MKKFALLIGIENYEDETITPVKYAGADVEALAQRLSRVCGFDSVRLLTNAKGKTPSLGRRCAGIARQPRVVSKVT